MYCAVVGVIVAFLIIVAVCSAFSIPESGPFGLVVAIIFFGLGIYLGTAMNNCDKLRQRVFKELKPVIIVGDHAYIQTGSEMKNMSDYFRKNIGPEASVEIYEWDEKGGWITFDKSTEYELVTKATN